MIPHRNPSFLIDKSSPKQIKTPGSPPGVLFGAALCRRVDAALCRCSQSPPESQRAGKPISPNRFREILRSRSFRSMRSRYKLPGTAVSSGRCPPPLCRRVLPAHAKRPRAATGSFSIPAGAGSAALLQAVDGKGIEPEVLIKPESCLIAIGHTEFPGASLPHSARRILPPTQKGPTRWRGLFLFRQEPDQLRFCRQSMVKG